MTKYAKICEYEKCQEPFISYHPETRFHSRRCSIMAGRKQKLIDSVIELRTK